MSDDGARVEKDRFTSLDTLALVRELRGLGRTHLDKAFDAEPGAWSLTLRSESAGRRELYLRPGQYAALRPPAGEHAETPGPLARELRRLLASSLISDVPDPAGERYLTVRSQRGDAPEPLELAVEFFGTGNLLVARGGKILAVAHAKRWAHRSVRVGADYQPPPSRGDPWHRSVAELEAALTASRTDRVTTLAARLSFGGPLAEELLVRAGLPREVPAATDPGDAARRLDRSVRQLLAELGDQPKGYLYLRAGEPIDAEPYRSARWAADPAIERIELASFSEAADRFFPTTRPATRSPEEERSAAAAAELQRQREQQRAAVLTIESAISEGSRRAEAIYAHYAEAEAARAAAAALGTEAEYVETELGGVRVPLLVRRPLEQSARSLYAEVKRQQTRLAGAQTALHETEAQLLAVQPPAPEAVPGPSETRARARRPAWFESFRWFLTSEGFVVIAGRDAVSNDRMVKRYLRAGDVYFHADLQGAASVILKASSNPGVPVGPVSRAEAGQFAVAFSKAWRAGLASAGAFYVDPEQVSKSGATGEFVARGAFVIHGTKNLLKDLPLEIGLGEVEVQGERRWSAAPPEALRSRGRLRVVLVPGEERDRPRLEVELSRELGVPRSLLQSLAPAGGISVRRT